MRLNARVRFGGFFPGGRGGCAGLFYDQPAKPGGFGYGRGYRRHAADRHDRRLIVRAAHGIYALTALMIVAALTANALDRNLLFVAVFLIGCARAFELPTGHALMPALVPAPLISRAVAAWTSANQVAVIGGPALGGLIYALSPVLVGLICLIFFTSSITCISLIRVERPPAPREPPTFASVLAGFDYVRTRRRLLGVITLDLFVVLLGGATALLPIFAKDILDVGPVGLGLGREVLGGAVEDVPGYDLRGLVIGAEGTMGLVTRATLRLTRQPEGVRTLLGVFESVDAACQAVSGIIAAGIVPAALEMKHPPIRPIPGAIPRLKPRTVWVVLLPIFSTVVVEVDPDRMVDEARRDNNRVTLAPKETFWERFPSLKPVRVPPKALRGKSE
jgi:MFS family permease